MKRSLKDDFIPVGTTFINSWGGKVGRFMDENGKKRIGIQFKDKEKTESPIYILEPWMARYAGWNLLRRGIVDGIKLMYERRMRK